MSTTNYTDTYEYEMVVVGSGTAGLTAALRAAELGRSVAVLEKAPREHQGGHTRFSESFRVPSVGTDLEQYGFEFDIKDYTVDDFYEDILDQTNEQADRDLARYLAENAGDTIEWLTETAGVDWQMEPLAVGYTVARTWFDGEEYVDTLTEAAEREGADFYFKTEARGFHRDSDGRVVGVDAITDEGPVRFEADAVTLAAGAYSSSDEKRVRYYGPDYDAMKVRGSRYNTGEAIEAASDAGADLVGQWGGAHMALIDAASPDVEGGANRVDGYQYGVMVNDEGERFVDEGQDARAHTYAKFGRLIFEEPNHVAYIVVDSKVHDLIRATGPSDPVVANDLHELLEEVGCGDPETAVENIEAYNEACDPDEFNPEELDGNEATDVTPPKTNWALPIDDPPYYAYAVTGGITFSFGGVRTNTNAEVIDSREEKIPGLYAAGNSTGGLFFDNYPGGTGQMNAAVYGKTAAESAHEYIEEAEHDYIQQ